MLVDAKEIQKRYRISRPTIYELIKEGMPHIRVSERILRFDPDDVRRWFEDRQKRRVI